MLPTALRFFFVVQRQPGRQGVVRSFQAGSLRAEFRPPLGRRRGKWIPLLLDCHPPPSLHFEPFAVF